jgi:hypothetical protein
VIVTALVFSMAGCAVFLAAHGVGALYAARSLPGIATGIVAVLAMAEPGSRRPGVLASLVQAVSLIWRPGGGAAGRSARSGAG